MNCRSLPFRSAGAAPTALLSKEKLTRFVEDLVQALEPQSGIEYWADVLIAVDSTLERIRAGKVFVHNVFAYACSGSNEGMRIEAGVRLRGGEMVLLASAKSFGSDDECWRLAKYLSGAFELLFWYEHQPYIVDMRRALTTAFPRPSYTSGGIPSDGFIIDTTDNSISVRHQDGADLDLWKFNGSDMGWFIRAYASDWLKVLSAAGAASAVTGPHASVLSEPPDGLAIYSLGKSVASASSKRPAAAEVA